MTTFTVYNSNTGQISRTGSCPADHVALQPQTGESVVAVSANPMTQYINVSTQALETFPASPGQYYIWDWPTKTWILPANALAQAQADQVKTVTATYSAAIQAPVSYMATTFQADAGSQATLNKVLTVANGTVPAGFYWVDAANNQVAMTFAQLQGLASAMWAQGWTAFQELQTKKAAIAAATTIAAVQAIV